MHCFSKRLRTVFSAAASIILTAVLLFSTGTVQAGQDDSGGMRAALLTRELGDPESPGNMKIVLTLPQELTRPGANLDADAFQVHVYPDTLSPEAGTAGRYRAKGLYYWRDGSKIFLDVRAVPRQDGECQATVRVAYAPEGKVLAENTLPGQARYTNENVDVVLAVDISLSMDYNDPQKRRVAAARTFLEMAKRGGGVGRVALVTFNHAAQLITPLIPLDQGERLLTDLDNIGAEGLTNLDEPLRFSLSELRDSRRPVVILLTDGKNEGHDYEGAHLNAAREGVRIFAVGLSRHADHLLLKEMADATGGIYFRAIDDEDLPKIYARLAAELGKRQLLQAIPLPEKTGTVSYPIDASVRRLVTFADNDARLHVAGPQGSKMADSDESGVHMGIPEPGLWTFSWDDAEPDKSNLAVFGDTPFFLDLFPPQLRGNRLAVGATLARGESPLRGGEVWVEPIADIMPGRLVLYDDGNHGDGKPGDGVYGNILELENDVPDQFDVTARALGGAWDLGSFVRQSQGLAIRSGEPPPPKAALDGDVDFGVLYPGETGTAVARVDLQAHEPLDLELYLGWDGAPDWPELSSGISLPPGKRALELEMTVPDDARPGDYLGRFHLGDGRELDARSNARLRVGDVAFTSPGPVDFGVVPPGTFISKRIQIPYHADKEIALRTRVEDGGDLTLNNSPEKLETGDGRITLEAVVSAPMDGKTGSRSGTIELTAGPGKIRVPVQWQVMPYSASPVDLEPVAGLPKPPQLGEDAAPLPAAAPSEDLWKDDETARGDSLPSPLDKVNDIFDGGQPSVATGDSPGNFDFSKVTEPREKGGGFWSAWWMYILAALLLLLLLLLILAYILYRLGKSALARFLLASAIANIVMLLIFIALLSSAITEVPRVQPSIVVNLVEQQETPAEAQFSRAEMTMLETTGASAATSSSGGGVEAANVSLEQASNSSASDGLTGEKSANLPDGTEKGIELAQVAEVEPMPLKSDNRQTLTRRERKSERQNFDQPAHEIPDMDEPQRRQNEHSVNEPAESHREVGEERLAIEASAESERPVWSDGVRPQNAITSEQGVLLDANSGAELEKVMMDRLVKRLDPRGRRSNHKEAPVETPEPRVQIDDPARDSLEMAAYSDSEQSHAEPGVEELRVDARAMGADVIGRKPGTILPPGVSELVYAKLEPMPRGAAGGDLAINTSPLGERRSARGTSARTGSALPGRDSNRPGTLRAGTAGSPGGDSSGRARGGFTGTKEGTTGEQRFEGVPGGGVDGGLEGAPNGSGTSRSPSSLAGGGNAPSPFAGNGGTGERMDSQPFSGGGGDGLENRRGQPKRGQGNGAGEYPQLASAVPGYSGDGGSPQSGNGKTRGRGEGDRLGEGRYDDMAGLGSSGMARKSRGRGEYGVGHSNLGSGFGGGDLDFVPLEVEKTDWKRNERREPRRSVNMAASSVDTDSLLIVLGDFARLPDQASGNLISSLDERLGKGLSIEERILSPNDPGLNDCLLALATPEEVRDWSDDAVGKVAAYLKRGGHLWMDASRTDQAQAFMSRLTKAAGGSYDELPASHQINDEEIVDALYLDGRIAAVVTYQDWRRGWRHGKRPEGDRAMRFLVRGLNYFLSGDAETGISLEPGQLKNRDLYIEPRRESMPDSLTGAVADPGRVWDEFGPETASSWRMPGWSDPGRLSAISDGQGGRALKIDLGSAKKGRAAAYRTLSPPQDFSGVKSVAFDAFYDGDGEAAVSMVFTVRDYDGWSDYETPTATLRKGWNPLRFSMTGATFRALSDDDEEGRALPGAAQTGRAGFFIYREAESPGVALFRNIRLH